VFALLPLLELELLELELLELDDPPAGGYCVPPQADNTGRIKSIMVPSLEFITSLSFGSG